MFSMLKPKELFFYVKPIPLTSSAPCDSLYYFGNPHWLQFLWSNSKLNRISAATGLLSSGCEQLQWTDPAFHCGVSKKSSGSARLVMTTIMGMVFGYFIRVSFAPVYLTKDYAMELDETHM
ncbi:hypothetical protein CsSME_00001874 [Camellia sinensis var. sinensis]